MTIYYVDPRATAGTKDGLTKENAFLSLAAAFAVATGNGDVIRCRHDAYDSLAADVTYNIAANNLSVESWHFTEDRRQSGFFVGHFSLSRSITFAAAATPAAGMRVVRFFGITFWIDGTTVDHINLFTNHPGISVFWEGCSFQLNNTATGSTVKIGGSGEYHGVQFFVGCGFGRRLMAQVIILGDHLVRFQNCRFTDAGFVYGPVFHYVEQGPDTILESCSLLGPFSNLLGGTLTGTRAARMLGGSIESPHWPNLTSHVSESGLWGCEREFRNVALLSASTGQTAMFSAIEAPGRFYRYVLPENPNSPDLAYELPGGIFISAAPAPASDLVDVARPITKIQAKHKLSAFPTFVRLHILGYNSGAHGSDPVGITAEGYFVGILNNEKFRYHAFTILSPVEYSPALVEDTSPPAAVLASMAYLGYTTAHYFDVPLEWLTGGTGVPNHFDEIQEMEFTLGIHLRNEASFHTPGFLYLDGVDPGNLVSTMEGGIFVQRTAEVGGGGYPDPIPGYKAVEIIDGKLTQVDVTLNEPPTGTPAVWDGTALRSLLPGESVVLQNP